MKKMMESKLKNKGGFTLVEMLIVVAIIAILMAISLPMVNSTLEKARDATDDANFRSAVGLAAAQYLAESLTGNDLVYYTDKAAQGKLSSTAPGDGYSEYKSQCTSNTAHGATGTSKGKSIKVTISEKGDVSANWKE